MTAFTDLLLPTEDAKVLVVTNDFPPRIGGIQTFVRQLVGELPPDRVVVHTSAHPGAGEYDAQQPYVVVRDRASVLLPTPAATRRVIGTMRRHGCSQIVYGASAPLGLMAPALRRAGARHQLAITHGHEVWWAALPGTRTLIRRIAMHVNVLTFVSDYTRRRIEPTIAHGDSAPILRLLSPRIDFTACQPNVGASSVREDLDIPPDALVVVCVGRLVSRKGQLDLVKIWPRLLSDFPSARLVLVGEGPDRGRLERSVRRSGLVARVCFAGSVPDVRPYLAAADVFASPSRERWWGLEVEAFGIAFAEAAAMGLRVAGARAGGTADAVSAGLSAGRQYKRGGAAAAAPPHV